MKVLLFRSNQIFDSRVNKYRNFYEREGLDYTIVGWDRDGKVQKKTHYDFFYYKAGVDVGGIKAMCNHLKWMIFVYRYLKAHKEVTTIHACDLNSAFPATLFKLLHKKTTVLIFDACDWFSANFAHYRLLNYFFKRMERFTCRYADELIICEPERKAQIHFKLKKEPLVMRNIPEIDINTLCGDIVKYKFDNKNPTLAYMGGFADARFLMELLTLVETEPVNLLIAGYGDKTITKKCEEIEGRSNVRYLGKVNMKDGLEMENAADVIYAMYCKVNPNHIFAAPNKYYEALLLGKPLITTKGTIVGDKVEKYDTGWTVEEDIEEMRMLLNNLRKEDIANKGANALKLWNERYKNELSEFFNNVYSKIIK